MNPGKDQYTTVGAYDDPRTEEELENSIAWDQRGNVEFLREKYKVCYYIKLSRVPVIRGSPN
jgi:hypothetical protein